MAISVVANQCNTCIPTPFFRNLLDSRLRVETINPHMGWDGVGLEFSPQVSTCERSSQWAWPPVKRW